MIKWNIFTGISPSTRQRTGPQSPDPGPTQGRVYQMVPSPLCSTIIIPDGPYLVWSPGLSQSSVDTSHDPIKISVITEQQRAAALNLSLSESIPLQLASLCSWWEVEADGGQCVGVVGDPAHVMLSGTKLQFRISAGTCEEWPDVGCRWGQIMTRPDHHPALLSRLRSTDNLHLGSVSTHLALRGAPVGLTRVSCWPQLEESTGSSLFI